MHDISWIEVWKRRKYDLLQWTFYNLLIGLLPVWASWLLLGFGCVVDFKTPFVDGTFLIFAATLSAASMSFFSSETKRRWSELEGMLFSFLLVTLCLGTLGFAAIVMLKRFSPSTLSPTVSGIVSVVALVLAACVNFRLAALRIAYTDQALMEEIAKSPNPEAELERERERLVDEAATQNTVDGAKL